MKRVLITGANSYIGMSFEAYVKVHYAEYIEIDTVDMQNPEWRAKDFSKYDVVFHVAGIAHSDNGKISSEREKLYYAVNTQLTIETAKKAKAEGVKQFVFMSSAIVYGDSAPIGRRKSITRETPTSPANCYGDSKVQAENGILPLNDANFKVVVLRPPMIYGRGSKGNYPLLAKIAKTLPIFPYVQNQRSMLYIENLCEFICLIILNSEEGIFWPQNSEYVNTTELVKLIADIHGNKLFVIKGLNIVLRFLGCFTKMVDKAFGNLVYEMELSSYKDNYRKFEFEESIKLTEGKL